MLYVILGHRIASLRAAEGGNQPGGIDPLAASMLIAVILVTPIGLPGALPAFSHPSLVLAGIGVCHHHRGDHASPVPDMA